MTSVSACHITLTPTQPVGSGRPQRESNPGPPHQEFFMSALLHDKNQGQLCLTHTKGTLNFTPSKFD